MRSASSSCLTSTISQTVRCTSECDPRDLRLSLLSKVIESQTESPGKQNRARATIMEILMKSHEVPPGKKLICRPFITVKGRKIFAAAYGKEAFCFLVDAEKGEEATSH